MISDNPDILNTAENSDNDRSNLRTVVDSRIKIKVGNQFKTAHLISNKSCDDDLDCSEENLISLEQVKALWERIKENNSLNDDESPSKQKMYLHELLSDSEIVLPSMELPQRNPELEKRLSKLRNMMAEQEYQRMTKNVNFSSRYKIEDSVGYQLKQMNSGLIGVFQLVISLAAAFLFGFMGIEVFAGYSFDLAIRLLLGIMCALIVGAAELYFLAINIAVGEGSMDPKKENNHVKST